MCVLFVLDAALVLLWTAPYGCVCLRPPQARVHVDVRLDDVLRWSHDPGKTAKTNSQ